MIEHVNYISNQHKISPNRFPSKKRGKVNFARAPTQHPPKCLKVGKCQTSHNSRQKNIQTHPNGPLSTRSPHSNPPHPSGLPDLCRSLLRNSRATLTMPGGSSCRALVGAVGVTSPWVDGSMVKKHKGFESTFHPTLNSSATKYTPSLQIQILQEIVPIVNNKEE